MLALKAGQTLSQATTLVAAEPGRVIESVHAASDALYVTARKGAYSELLRIPTGTTTIEEVKLPFEGHIGDMFSDPRAPGVTISMSSWVVAPAEYAYNPATKAFSALPIGTRGDIDASGFTVSDLEAKSHDGVMVPLSLVQPKGAKGAQIALVEAYGSYGISELADFSTRRAAAMREGITYGVCHVRGGGELGEAWRLGGKDANKHNTWEDIIACGEDLIARGITTKDKLFIIGGSAGGITMGRALTTRPDLFAGVLDLVPGGQHAARGVLAQRPAEHSRSSERSTTEDGFKNLYDMDTIQHVKTGVQYPAVMVTTGLNDPRVSPWEPAQGRGLASGLGLVEARAAAHRRAGGTRHRLDQDPDRQADGRLDHRSSSGARGRRTGRRCTRPNRHRPLYAGDPWQQASLNPWVART